MAGLDLGTLSARIKLDGAEGIKTELSNVINAVDETAEKFGITLPEGFSKTALATAGVVAGVVAVGKALWDCANEAAAYGDAIDKNSQKMGISSDAYQEWSYVLERNGASIDTLQKGMKTLNDKIASGSDAFDALGVSIVDANGNMRSSEDIMNDALHALAGMEEGVDRTALATELFGGKVAQELNPMLNAGADSMDELRQRANDLGMVMSAEGVANSAAFQDAMTDLHGALDGVKNSIGVAVLPILTTLINVIAQVIPVVATVISTVVGGIGTVVTDMGTLLSAVGSAISGVIQWFTSLPSKIVSALGNVGNLLKDAGKNIIEGFFTGIKEKFEEVKGFVSGIGNWIKEHKGPEDYDKNLLVENGQWIMEGLEKGLESSIPSLRKTLSGISGVISGTNFNASASLAYSTVGGSGSAFGRQETTYNVYINGTKINDDVAIENKFAELMSMLARKGRM